MNWPIELLRHRLPDYLAARGVQLRRNGRRLIGRCPNHDDTNPSFAVFGDQHELCGCYPCGFSGDVFAVSKWLGRSSTFQEAIADVAASLGCTLPEAPAVVVHSRQRPSRREVNPPQAPFALAHGEFELVHAARLAFSDAFHAGDPLVDEISASLGIEREVLRIACWGDSGLGIADGWLCYAYPQGLKWRNPDPHGKCRFRWLVGKATAPWRMGWVKPDTQTVYVTEGESDCLALMAAGLEEDGTAVCVASPGTSFQRDWAPFFDGKRVILCFDFDPPGRKATQAVAGILKGHAWEILTWKGHQ